MSVKDELEDLAWDGLAYLAVAVVVVALIIYADLGKWPVILIGTGIGLGVVMRLKGRKKRTSALIAGKKSRILMLKKLMSGHSIIQGRAGYGGKI